MPVGNGENSTDGRGDALTRLAGGFAAILAILGGGAIAGVLGRVARDDSVLLVVATVAGLVGAVFWGLSAAESTTPERRRLFLGTAGLVVVGGAAVFVTGIVLSESVQGRPGISATLSEGNEPIVKATITESGMNTGAVLFVRTYASTTEAPALDANHTLIYGAAIGPDANGNAKLAFSVPFHNPRFATISIEAEVGSPPNCQVREQSGCVFLSIPADPSQQSTGAPSR